MENAEYIHFLGQDAQVGLMYYGFNWGEVTFQDERTFDYNLAAYTPAWEAFHTIGTPVNMLTYFLEKYNGKLPAQDTYEYWNEDGTPATTSSEIYYARYYAGYDYNSVTNKVVFYGGITADSTFKTSMVNAISRIGYTGYDISGQPSELDYSMAELYFFKPLDLVPGTLQTYDGTGWHFDLWGWGYRCFPNFIFNGYDTLCRFNNAGSLPVTSLEVTTLSDLLGKSAGQDVWLSYPNPFLLPGGRHTLYKYIDNTNNWNGGGRFHDYPESWTNPEPEPEPEPEPDPSPSPPGGGGGGNNYISGTNPKDPIPSTGFSKSGMGLLYTPTSLELHNLSVFLWSDDFITNVHQLTASPIDAIISLMKVPFSLVSVRSAAKAPIFCGDVSSQVDSYLITQDFMDIDAGTIYVGKNGINNYGEKFGNAFDYSPYTTCNLYLPYVGMVQIDPNEIFTPLFWTDNGATLEITYRVNLLTGEAICRVWSHRPMPKSNLGNSSGETLDNLVGHYACQMGFSMPITGANYVNYYKNQMNSVMGVVGGSLLASAGSLTGNPMQIAGGISQAANSGINGLFNGQTFQKSGALAGSVVPCNYLYPFLEILQPCSVMDMPGHTYLNGLPASDYASSIGSLKTSSTDNYYEFESVNTSGFTGTNDEEIELINILKDGVFITK